MNLELVKKLKYGNSLINTTNNLEYEFYGMEDSNNVILIPKGKVKSDENKVVINISDMVWYKPNSIIEIVDGHYKTLKKINDLEPLYISDGNKIIGSVTFIMYGSDEYHIRAIESQGVSLMGTYHICQFGEIVDRNKWVLMTEDEMMDFVGNKN